MSDQEGLEGLVARGAKGDQGDQGEQGEPGKRGKRGDAGVGRTVRRAMAYLFALNSVLIIIGYAWLTHQQDTTRAGFQRQADTTRAEFQRQEDATRAEFAEQITANDRKFCAVVGGFTAVAVPKPSDPAANPSRETSYEWYVRFVHLGSGLGCK